MTFTRQAASAVSIIVGASAFVACARAAAPASAAPAPMTLPVALVAPPDPRAELRAAIDSMIGAQEFRNMHWGVLVVDALDGDTLYSHNAGKLFMPASNQKILTGATALAQLGPDFRFRTTFAACGQVRRGTLQGDLVVHGRGDPSFSDAMRGDAMIPMREVADSLAAHGIRRIRGSIIAGADAFPDAPHGFGWAWDDFTEPYSAGVDELFFNEGFARIVLTPNPRRTRGAVIATSRPIRTYPRVEARQLTLLSASVDSVERRRARATTVPDTATRGYRLEGAVAVRDSTVLTVAYPEQRAAFLAALREGLAERGVKVEGASVRPRADAPAMAHCVGADTLYTLSSPPLREIMPVFEKPSQNQIGEILLKTLGLEKTGVGSADSGRRVVERQLAAWGATPDGAAVRDGSGLSRHDYVSPETLVRVLGAMRRDTAFRVFYDALPIAGVDGTIANRMRNTPAEGNLRAKTGTIDKARSLSGYVTAADGRPLVFSILSNNFTAPVAAVTRVQDAIGARLAALRVRPTPAATPSPGVPR
ncbi:MAG: D-alanyl-D-alanine carboxypeptidase/D-alanyl-D-alanine-endopeptidase [Gemmatimonadaceae bacterium]